MASNTNLGNTPVSQGYTQLFHTGETGGLTSTLQQVFDGDGTGSDLYLATNKVKIGTAGSFLIGSKTIQEYIQDIVGDMFDTNGSHTNVTATYDDAGDGAIDLNATGAIASIIAGTGITTSGSGNITINVDTSSIATRSYVDTEVAGLVDSAPTTLDTLNELASALGDDPNFATTTATNIGTKLAKASNLSDLTSASTARTNLGVDPAGTDNSTNVTLAGSLDYLTLSGQQITRNAIDLTTDVTGILPSANLDSDTAHLSGTQTFSGAKTFSSDVKLTATNKLYFDGGTHTYIKESANDVLDFYVGTDSFPLLRLEESGTDSVFTTDNVHLAVGTHKDLRIYHNSSSSNNNIENYSGSLYVTNYVDDADIIFRSDNGSGGVAEYYRLNGDNATNVFSKNVVMASDAEIYLQTGGESIAFMGVSDANYRKALYANNDDHYVTNRHTGGDLILMSNNGSAGGETERLRFVAGSGTQNAYFSNVNVGIGVTNPSEKLEVSGGGADTFIEIHNSGGYESGLKLLGGSLDIWKVYLDDADNNFYIYEDSNQKLKITSAGAITFNNAYTFPTSDGSSGHFLKTNGSGSLLFEAGNIAYTDLGSGSLGLNDDNKTLIFSSSSASWIVDYPSSTMFNSGTNVDNRLITATGATNGRTLNGEAELTYTGGELKVNRSGSVTNKVTITGGSTAVLDLNSTGDSFIEKDTGNSLYLANNAQDKDIYFRINDGGTQKNAIQIDASENALVKTHGNLTTGGQLNIQDTNAIIYRNSGQMELITYGGYNIDLNPAGDVRIDGASLVFKNNAEYIYFKDASGTSFRGMGINSGNNFYLGPIDPFAGGSMLYGASANLAHHVFYAGNNERMRIESTGDVGIGINNPVCRLHIYGNQEQVIRFQNGTTSNIQSIEMDSSRFYFYNRTTSTASLGILNNGNVGIGDMSPDAKLEVLETGTGAGTGGIITGTATQNGNAGIRFRTDGTDRWAITTIGTNGDSLRFRDVDNGTDRVTFDGAGNVTIANHIDIGNSYKMDSTIIIDSAKIPINLGDAMGSNRSRSVLVTDYAIVTSPTISGWYTIASASIANARGGGSISIGFTGGYFSPRTFTCDFEVDWSGNLNRCNIVNRTNDITKVRIIETGSTTELQAYFDISSSQGENTQNMRVMFTRDKYNPYWSIENPLTQESSPSVTGEEVGNGRGDYFYGADINTFGVYNSNVVFNEHSKDCDFRIETNNNANTLFIEGSTDRVAIGHNDPDTLLHLSGNPVVLKFERPGQRALRMGVPDNTSNFVISDSDDLKTNRHIDIDGSGDIGIGTTSTTHKVNIASNSSTNSVLRIDGDHARGANRYALDVQDDDGNRRGTARFRHTSGSGNPPIIISEGYDHAYIFQSKNTSASDAEQFRIEHYDGNVRINSLRGDLDFYSGSGHEFKISTGLNRSYNNLVIGPVNNNSKAYIRANDGYSTATTPDYTFWYNDQCGIFHPAGNQLGFSTGAESFRIDDSRRVLIGGTSASGHGFKLEVLNSHAYVKGPDGWNGNGDKAIVALGSAVSNESFGCGYVYGTGMVLSTYKASGGGSFGSGTQDSLVIADTTGQASFINDVVAFASSDKRLKENIKPLDNALDKICKIKGVEFDWIDGKDEHGNSVHSNVGHDVGVIAQEIEEVLPEVVTTRKNGYKAVKYEKIVPLLIQAIKEQQKQIEELKNG
tara:strand:- start:1254 stop:6314 length:5061 start_codon:yes stop_codon:yes gene_type:complete